MVCTRRLNFGLRTSEIMMASRIGTGKAKNIFSAEIASVFLTSSGKR